MISLPCSVSRDSEQFVYTEVYEDPYPDSSQYSIMPRDLFPQRHEEDLTESPDAQTPRAGTATDLNWPNEFTIHRNDTDETASQISNGWKMAEQRNKLHPYVQTLSIADLESCDRLESSCFPEEERCTREKVYLPTVLTVCCFWNRLFHCVCQRAGGFGGRSRLRYSPTKRDHKKDPLCTS